MTWSETFLDVFKKNDVRFISYVPDNVLTPLIKGVTSDNYFISVNATREDEAMGMVAGAWMGGMKGVRDDADVGLRGERQRARVADRAVPDPGDHGDLGARHHGRVQHRPGSSPRIMRPMLDTLAVAHHTLTDEANHALHRRPLDQAGGHDAEPGRLHPVAAADRRKSGRRMRSCKVSSRCRSTGTHLHKVFNRTELTKRSSPSSSTRRRWSPASATPISICSPPATGRRISTCSAAWGSRCPIALGVAMAQPERGVIALEGDGSILMSLGCLTTIAHGGAAQPHHHDHGQRPLPDHRQAGDRDRQTTPTSSRWRRASASPTAIGCATRSISTS